MRAMSEDASEDFRARLRALREARRLSQEQFAEIAALNYKHYQEIERGGKKEVRLSTLVKIAKALEIPIYQLFTTEPAESIVTEVAPPYRAKRRPAGRRKSE